MALNVFGSGKTKYIKVLTGHLTEKEKAVVRQMLSQGLMEGSVNKRNYHITVIGDIYTVKVSYMDRGLVPVPGTALRLSTYTSTFRYE